MFETNYQRVVDKSEHFKAIGQTEVWLEREGDKPWDHVSEVEDGCCVRMGTRTDATFKARHPCGIMFRWSVDLENREANGSGVYGFDIKGIRAVIHRLPKAAAEKFAAMLAETAKVIRAKADEWQRAADSQRHQAIALERILDD